MNGNTAAVITVSDKGARGERTDTSGPALVRMLAANGWDVIYTALVPDERQSIERELIKCADELNVRLVLTTGGTGFSPRDVTPEATLAVIDREARGIPEAMRAESMKITPMGCLSRAVCGIRKVTLIVNLPGSEKAARENFAAVGEAVRHGAAMLDGRHDDCGARAAKILAVCVSERKGEQKHPVETIRLLRGHGIEGDAHAGAGRRQISLLGVESVAKIQARAGVPLPPGAFAENILTEGILLYELPVGVRFKIGTALCEVTQIGKECHNGCAIRKACGDCAMPREGIFASVLEDGEARSGDLISVLR